jgi:hypothetical protein
MSLNLATLIKVDICRQTDELFERLHNKPFWIWDKEQHKFEDIRTKGDTLEIVYSKKQEILINNVLKVKRRRAASN